MTAGPRCPGRPSGTADGYLAFARIGLGDQAVRDRTGIARDFTGSTQTCGVDGAARHPPGSELRSTGAWPLLCHAIGTGRTRLDLELTGVKQLSGLGSAVEARDPPGFAAARAAANRLGWKLVGGDGARRVPGGAVGPSRRPGRRPHHRDRGRLRRALAAEHDPAVVPPRLPQPARRRPPTAVQTRVIDAPATRPPWAAASSSVSLMSRWPRIHGTLLRYVRVRAAVLRPRSVETLVNDLLPFGEYLSARHPQSCRCDNSGAPASRDT